MISINPEPLKKLPKEVADFLKEMLSYRLQNPFKYWVSLFLFAGIAIFLLALLIILFYNTAFGSYAITATVLVIGFDYFLKLWGDANKVKWRKEQNESNDGKKGRGSKKV